MFDKLKMKMAGMVLRSAAQTKEAQEMIAKIRYALAGKKTYIVAAVGIVVVVGNIAGVIPDESSKFILETLGLTSIATIAAKINRWIGTPK